MTTVAPPVIVRPPSHFGDVEVCVHHREWGVEVDIRPAGSNSTWTPLEMMGGTFEVRSA